MIDHVIDSRYRIIEPIGEGGMGWVYRAEHIKIRRPVAIKLLNPEYREYQSVAERFEREAFAAGRIDHPNCVAVFDCATLPDGAVYLAMELLHGRSVADELDANPDGLGVERSLHIARHLLSGLSHAHQAGIIHRDIKPDNVLLVEHEGDKDFVKILDFGIAKLVGEAIADAGGMQLTDSGLTMGTPFYMSPEQAFGKPLDGRSDLYAASVLLYEMLTGRLPFYDEDKLVVLSLHTTKDPPLFAEIAPQLEIPTEVELMVRQGLAKNPDSRISNAEAYVARIDRVLTSLGDRARRASGTSAVPLVRGNGEGSAATPASPASGQPPLRDGNGAGSGLTSGGSGSPGSLEQPAMAFAPMPAAPGLSPPEGSVISLHSNSGTSTGRIAAGGSDAPRPSDPSGSSDSSGSSGSSGAPAADPAHMVALGPLDPRLTGGYNLVWPQPSRYARLRSWLAYWGGHWRALSPRLRWSIIGASVLVVLFAIVSGGQKSVEGTDPSSPSLPSSIEGSSLLATYVRELEQGSDCEARRAAVTKLRELGDKRAIPALEKARHHDTPGTPDYNGCLIDDARQAILHLQGK